MKKCVSIVLAMSVAAVLSLGVGAEEAAVMTHEEFMAAEVDDEVTVETYVQAVRDFAEGKATVYAQSEDGAYFIYEAECSEEDYAKLTEGQAIRVTGFKAEWAGEIEIMDGAIEVLYAEPYVAEAVDMTELLGKDELADHQNEKFVVKGLTVASAGQDDAGNDTAFLYNWDGSGQEGDDLYFNLAAGDETYSFTVRTDLSGADSDVYKAVKELAIGDVVDVTGFMYWYEGPNPHVTAIEAAKAE